MSLLSVVLLQSLHVSVSRCQNLYIDAKARLAQAAKGRVPGQTAENLLGMCMQACILFQAMFNH